MVAQKTAVKMEGCGIMETSL